MARSSSSLRNSSIKCEDPVFIEIPQSAAGNGINFTNRQHSDAIVWANVRRVPFIVTLRIHFVMEQAELLLSAASFGAAPMEPGIVE